MSGRCNNCLATEGVVRMWGSVRWCRQCVVDSGALGRRALVGHDFGGDAGKFTRDVLADLANGPIMDSNALYLPAGKLSKAEADARDRAALQQTW